MVRTKAARSELMFVKSALTATTRPIYLHGDAREAGARRPASIYRSERNAAPA
jgi:hypothetical protein